MFVVENESSLGHVQALMDAALAAAGFAAQFTPAPKAKETRSLFEMQAGRVHLSLMPVTPERLLQVQRQQLRMLPIPLERGLLGWRACFTLQGQEDKLAQVRSVGDLRRLVLGQGVSWHDSEIYRRAQITVREIPDWRDGEFAQQLEMGVIDAFPMGLEESLSFFLAHFQIRYPQLRLDRHLLLRYPWFRFLWVSPHPSADALYAALQAGFDTIAANGTFLRVWQQHRQEPPASAWQGRRVLELNTPWFNQNIVPQRYQHLLLQPQALR